MTSFSKNQIRPALPKLYKKDQRGFIGLLFSGIDSDIKFTEKKINQMSENYYKILYLTTLRTRLFTLKYQKILLFILCIIATYFLMNNSTFVNSIQHLGSLNYAGVFIAGLFFSFGFTTPTAAAILIAMKPENLILSAIIGGIAATISDYVIFKFVKISFENEFMELKKERPFLFIKEKFTNKINPTLMHYITFAFGGFLLSSPLPDEAGVMVLTGIMEIKPKTLIAVSFLFKTLGILVLLLI